MRVLVVPKWYPWPDRPVFGIFCREHARALACSHDVTVVAADAVRSPNFLVFELDDQMEAGLRTLRVRYRRPAFRPAAAACQLLGMIAALFRLRRGGWRPDVVHAHVYSAGIPALVLGRLAGCPVVITEHYTGFQRGLITGLDRLAAKLAFRYADLVAPVSEELAEYVRAIAPSTRVRVVDNVVDTRVFHPPPAPRLDRPETMHLLTVAAFAAKKGHAYLLEAVAEIRRDFDVQLDLVGSGDLETELRAKTRRLGIADVVRFRGELEKEEVAEAMRVADLFVLPSLYENLPCVLIEAMASGLPFVATTVGGVQGLADAGGGWLCPPGDPRALAAAIRTARSQRVDPEPLAATARRRFGYEAITSVWTQIYEGLPSRAGMIS
jgi:glycosyltransferase involved in cell wall biosynthesis